MWQILILLFIMGCSSQATMPIVDNNVVLLDVRTPSEYDAAHLEGAKLIDYYSSDFKAQIEQLPRDDAYVVYCRTGARSGNTVKMMADMGFTDVTNMEGGINAWIAKGNPVIRPAAQDTRS
ncbi:rhodanese-like domain-containing protein [Candidatus Woesearchaeota archaeon]|nr:rhodanese-like domain-containing protein [Candidatus Woesearchaeota archaeon]